MQRVLLELRRLPHKFTRFKPSPELLANLRRWDKFLSDYNGVSLLRSSPWLDNESRFCTDAYLSGVGGFFDGRFFHSAFPPFIDPGSLTIPSLEMLAVIVSVKLWSWSCVANGYWSELTIKKLNSPSILVALAFLPFSHAFASFCFMLLSSTPSYSPYTHRTMRTLSQKSQN